MAAPEVLRRLLTAPGPSGYEGTAAAVWREAASVFAGVSHDTLGSSVARVPGTARGLRVAVVGHIDEIGIIVSHIDEKGFLRFTGVGGWDPIILVGQRVEIAGRDGPVAGVVGRKPIHLLQEDDRKQVPELRHLHVDIGARDAEDAGRLVRIGDVGVIAGEPVDLPNERVVSRSMDNRLGCFVAYEAARLVAEAGGAPGELAAVAAVQEEVTFAGARTTAYSLEPDVAIVVDVTFATDQPGIELGALSAHELGSGPVIMRGASLHPAVSEGLVAAAEAEGIPFTLASSGRYTSTDADVIHLSRAGIPTAVVSVPLRYMHSPVELVQLDDVENTARLIAAFAQRLEPGTSFLR
ncbi:MAG: hypothetical protein QOK31_2094 [Solirubrobacteraceae bacterium]|jgi:endoglucanase|nr:hypothetical protein [Solirubrobacteraceae bacterium]